MLTKARSRRIWLAVAAAAVAVAFVSGCGGSSPTEPKTTGGRVNLTVTAGVDGTGEPGTLTVRAATCDCATGDWRVTIDGSQVVSVPCAGSAVMPLSPGFHSLTFSSESVVVPVKAELTADATGSYLVGLSCPNR